MGARSHKDLHRVDAAGLVEPAAFAFGAQPVTHSVEVRELCPTSSPVMVTGNTDSLEGT